MAQYSLNSDHVMFIGRSAQEYLDMFQLNAAHLRGQRVLDVAAGAASFRAKMARHGVAATAVDILYDQDAETLARHGRATLDAVLPELKRKQTRYTWGYYGDPDRHAALRRRALSTFIADYRTHRSAYVHGALPDLNFPDTHFDLVLCSHFLFLYDDRFDAAFHEAAVKEMLRVCRGEVRIYPLTGLSGERSSHVTRVLDMVGNTAEAAVCSTRFRFLKEAGEFLRLRPLHTP